MNYIYLQQSLAKKLNVDDRVTFIKSFSDDERAYLLRHSTVLLYTPANEHFGIVPVESMFVLQMFFLKKNL